MRAVRYRRFRALAKLVWIGEHWHNFERLGSWKPYTIDFEALWSLTCENPPLECRVSDPHPYLSEGIAHSGQACGRFSSGTMRWLPYGTFGVTVSNLGGRQPR